MNVYLQIISLSCTVNIAVNHGLAPLTKYLFKKSIKPFSCAFCMSFWIGLFIFVLKYGTIEGIGYACITGIITALIDRKLL
jgi:hypothetical protein